MNSIRQAEPDTPEARRRRAEQEREEIEALRRAQRTKEGLYWYDRDHKAVRSGFPEWSQHTYGADHSLHFLDHPEVRHVRVSPSGAALHLRLTDQSTIECRKSELILHTEHTIPSIAFLVDSAKTLGWNQVRLEGTPAFRLAMADALTKAGIRPIQPQPEAGPGAPPAPPSRPAPRPRARGMA